MKTYSVTVSTQTTTRETICLGVQGENLAREIVFDCAAFAEQYGGGTACLLHQRVGDQAPYPCAVTQVGNAVTWPITAADVAAQGLGKAELRWMVGDTLAKTVGYGTRVLPTLGEELEEPPEPWQSWVDQVLEAAQAGTTPEQIAAAVAAYLAEHPISETDPTVPEWAKQATKPSYTAEEVGALSQTALQTGVDAALAQAKASGDFDGPQGPQGPQGPAGANGYTPVKGTDYWTAADQAAMVEDVLAALPAWEGGSY